VAELEETREQLALGQVTGRTEEHDDVWVQRAGSGGAVQRGGGYRTFRLFSRGSFETNCTDRMFPLRVRRDSTT